MNNPETKRTTKTQGSLVGVAVIAAWKKIKIATQYLSDINWQINQIDWSLAIPFMQEFFAILGGVVTLIFTFDKARNKIGVQKPVVEQAKGPVIAEPASENSVEALFDDETIFPKRNDYELSLRSLENLKKVHPDLKKLVRIALQVSRYDFTVTEGIRTEERQRMLVETGKSTTMNSRHLHGLAVDVMVYDENGKGTWEMPYYEAVADAFAEASRITGITVEWGGDWRSFKDGPHFQLPHSQYPNPVGFVVPKQA